MKEIPNNSKVVVVGGGVIGCSVAYHLAKFGWKDTILLERDQLTSGTTWHAAGLVSQLGPSAAITKIRKYTLDLYKELENKVDYSAGLNVYKGHMTYKAVADIFGHEYILPNEATKN